jgi:hypothetical protein
MTVKAKPERPKPTLRQDGDHVVVEYPWHRYRFLLSDGRTLDVVAIRDDSTLRELVLQHTKAERIEGAAELVYEDKPKRTIRRSATVTP